VAPMAASFDQQASDPLPQSAVPLGKSLTLLV
jgi:hypothetical protein